MAGSPYLHRLEYRREISKYQRVHVYTELADDQGFCFTRRDLPRQEWYERYTRVCAEDFLETQQAEAGTWLVSTYRLPLGEEPVPLCTVRIKLAGRPPYAECG